MMMRLVVVLGAGASELNRQSRVWRERDDKRQGRLSQGKEATRSNIVRSQCIQCAHCNCKEKLGVGGSDEVGISSANGCGESEVGCVRFEFVRQANRRDKSGLTWH